MAHLAVGVLNPKSKRCLIKVERAGKARSKRPHRSYQASAYLTAAEYAALERAAAVRQRTVASLIWAIVLGFLDQEKAAGGLAPSPDARNYAIRAPAALLRGSHGEGDPTAAGARWLAKGGAGAKGRYGTPCTQTPMGEGSTLDCEGIGQRIGRCWQPAKVGQSETRESGA